MDAELAAASELMVRPDLVDLPEARRLMSTAQPTVSWAELELADQVAVSDLEIPRPARDAVPVRLYRPASTRATLGGVLFMHGGAFVGGDLEAEHSRCVTYAAQAECVVVSVNYRLAPEDRYPAALEDCLDVLDWMERQGPAIGVDPSRLAVGGVSAGGALAAGVALRALDAGRPRIRSQLLLFPVIDDRMDTPSMRRFDATPVWDNRNNALMWSAYLGDGEGDHYAIPGRREDLQGLPEALVVTAELDPLRDEGLAFATRLLAAGVTVDVRNYAGAYHVFDQLVPDAAISQRSLGDQVAFVKRTLRA